MLNSLEEYQRTSKRSNSLAFFVGFDFINKLVYKPLTIITIFDAIFYIFVNAYSAVIFRHDFTKFVFCLVTWGFGFQGLAMIVTVIKYHPELISLHETAIVFHTNRNASGKNHETLSRYISTSKRVFNLLDTVFISSGVMCLIYTIYMSSQYKKLAFGFVIPLTDTTTNNGLLINVIFQIIQIYITFPGVLSVTRLYLGFIMHCCTQYEVLVDSLKELKNISDLNKDGESNQEIRKILQEVINSHEELVRFTSTLEKLLNKLFLVQVMSIVFQVATALLAASTWWLGYFIIATLTSQLLLTCIFGTLMQTRATELMFAVYDSSWHMFQLREQKILLSFLHIVQHPTVLTFGGRALVNVDTFLEVYKKIYSFFMMLQNSASLKDT